MPQGHVARFSAGPRGTRLAPQPEEPRTAATTRRESASSVSASGLRFQDDRASGDQRMLRWLLTSVVPRKAEPECQLILPRTRSEIVIVLEFFPARVRSTPYEPEKHSLPLRDRQSAHAATTGQRGRRIFRKRLSLSPIPLHI